jgi:hypothetical protein
LVRWRVDHGRGSGGPRHGYYRNGAPAAGQAFDFFGFREVQLGFGDPVLQMVPLKEDDDLINQLLEHNPRFEEYLRSCMRTRTMSAETALKRLK